MGEEFQGGVCGGTWWNQPLSLFSGGGAASGLSSPCSVAQLGGGYDLGSFGWPNEVIKGKPSFHAFDKNNSLCDNIIMDFPPNVDSPLDILGFGLSPTSSTTDWNQPNLLFNDENNEGGYNSLLQDDVNSSMNYSMFTNNSSSNNNNNSCNQGGLSPPMAPLATSSNSSGDSSTITYEAGPNTFFPMMSSSASYLIQTLFDDYEEPHHEPQQPMGQPITPSYGAMASGHEPAVPQPMNNPNYGAQLLQNNKVEGGMSLLVNGHSNTSTPTTLSDIRASLLNSLRSRSRSPNTSFDHKPRTCASSLTTKANNEEGRDSKSNVNEQPQAKRPRIETPSPLPTFKVRKEKLGDRITALQQLVSPFGKTDTASVLHEAIEYIKFLHDQVSVLSTPYLKNGDIVQNQQGSHMMKDNEEPRPDLRSRGLCLVPISSTFPVAHETPVDFWTPTFGGTPFM